MPGGVVTAGNARLELEIIFDNQAGDQVELLKDQPEPIAPQGRPAGIRQIRHRDVVQPDLATVSLVQSAIRCSSVLLPLPDSPVSATRSPAAMRRFTPRNTTTCSPAER